jgi:hypothetical protein
MALFMQLEDQLPKPERTHTEGGWINLHSPIIAGVIESKEDEMSGHVARTETLRNCTK